MADRVLTINHWYDGPRLGVAEYQGAPHVYEAEFDHSSEEYGDTYFLSPINQELLALVLENWAIWLEWEAAHRRGDVADDSHPGLSTGTRYAELEAMIKPQLKSDPDNRIYKRATFSYEGPGRDSWVEWSDVVV